MMGAIFGTGTNGAYVEDVAKILKLGNSPAAAKGGKMVVNTEWGGFNNTRSHLPSTPYDNALDRLSINPGFQAFEKFISGMYLGEITRLVILSLIDAAPKPLLFNGKCTAGLNTQWGLDTSIMSDVETAWDNVGHSSTNLVPQWHSFDDGKVDKDLAVKLERVRDVIISKVGVSESDVSLRDAMVGVRFWLHESLS